MKFFNHFTTMNYPSDMCSLHCCLYSSDQRVNISERSECRLESLFCCADVLVFVRERRSQSQRLYYTAIITERTRKTLETSQKLPLMRCRKCVEVKFHYNYNVYEKNKDNCVAAQDVKS